MTEPHPLRCETCKKDCVYNNEIPDDELFHFQKLEYGNVRFFTSVKGCSSHSSAKCADAVLDILNVYLNGWKEGFHHTVYIRQVEVLIEKLRTDKGIKEVIKPYKKELKELRQQQEHEVLKP